MQKNRRWIAVIVMVSLILGMSGAPMPANANGEDTETVVAVEQSAGVEQSAEQSPSGESLQNQTSEDPKPQPQTGVAGKYQGVIDFIPGYVSVQRQAPATGDGSDNPVKIDVQENFEIVIDNQAKANTGASDAVGTQVVNAVNKDSQAAAVSGSGEPIESNLGGTFAGNEVLASIDNSATALAISGKAGAANSMNDNEAFVAPDATVASKVFGSVVNSEIKINALFNYWAVISGLSEASSGDGSAEGLLAANQIDTGDEALAKGDSAASSTGDVYGGSVFSENDTENMILNTATAFANTGESNAYNVMKQNDIEIAPTVEALLTICGDVINSNITINLAYNFLAVISGFAQAATGDSAVTGAAVDNAIDNTASSTAIGDAPSTAGDNGALSSTGSAVATNETSNNIKNDGSAVGASGNASAINSMLNNTIIIAPVICSQIDILNTIINANVVINIAYNFWATVSGEADAKTGATTADGLVAENAIDNSSSALAIGDAARSGVSGSSNNNSNGNATAVNDTNNSIGNTGDALSESGNATAINNMFDNMLDLSPALAAAVIIVTPIADNSFVIDIVYDVWSNLTGSAKAKTGAATSSGATCSSSISSGSEAVALAKARLTNPDGSATAINTSDNRIDSAGFGTALTGNADAMSNMTNALISMTGYMQDDTIVDNMMGVADKTFALKAHVSEVADSKTGDAAAVGVIAASYMESSASSKDIFGRGGISVNDSDDDIVNHGVATAVTSDAKSRSGSLPGSGISDNVVIIGLNGPVADFDREPRSALNSSDVAGNDSDSGTEAAFIDDAADNGGSGNSDGVTYKAAGAPDGSSGTQPNGTGAQNDSLPESDDGVDSSGQPLEKVALAGVGMSDGIAGTGAFIASIANSDLCEDYLGSVISAKPYDGEEAIPVTTSWLWLTVLLAAISAAAMTVLKPRRSLMANGVSAQDTRRRKSGLNSTRGKK